MCGCEAHRTQGATCTCQCDHSLTFRYPIRHYIGVVASEHPGFSEAGSVKVWATTYDLSSVTCAECAAALGFCAKPARGGPCTVLVDQEHIVHTAGFNNQRRANGVPAIEDLITCPNHPFRPVRLSCWDCGWKPSLKHRVKVRFDDLRDMILRPVEEGDEAMSLPDRLRTQDNNSELSWIFSRWGWVLAWGWSWFHWGFGIDATFDSKDEPGVWLSLGPLEYGFFKETS